MKPFLHLLLAALLLPCLAIAAPDAQELLRTTDAIRNPGKPFSVKLTLTEFENGNVKARNLGAYTPLRLADVPELDISFVESTEAPVGLGEPATTIVGPAIGNEIYNGETRPRASSGYILLNVPSL